MGKPAARIGDMHICPKVTGTPHVGGPLLPPGSNNVLIGGQPAAILNGLAACVGSPDVLVEGSTTVLINGKPAIRIGDTTAHGGVISSGYATVNIG